MLPPASTAWVTAAGLQGVPVAPAGPSPLWPLLASAGQLGPGSAKGVPKAPAWSGGGTVAAAGTSAASTRTTLSTRDAATVPDARITINKQDRSAEMYKASPAEAGGDR